MNHTTTQAQAPAVLTMAQVAEALQCGVTTAYEMARGDGPLSHLVVRVGAGGRSIRIRREGFEAWLAGEGHEQHNRKGR